MAKYLCKTWFCCALIGLFTILVWGTTVRFDFVWDDGIYITQNKSLRSLANIPKFFYRQAVQTAEVPSLSYRPIRNAVFALLYALEGSPAPRPWIFHLANVLGHAVTAMLLFSVALLLFQRPAGEILVAALLVGLGFAAHPVLSEVVCWAKCLDDILAAIFVLASARALLKWREGGRGYVAALAWFVLAAFSKESAAPFALVVVFILHGFHKLSWRRSATLATPFLAAAFFYAVCHYCIVGRSSQGPPLSGSYGQTLIDMLAVAVKYLRLLLGIPPFIADYNYMVGAPPHSIFSSKVLAGLFLILAFTVAAVWMWRREAWRTASFGLIWIAAFMLPVSNLVPMMQYMAERFLYLPSMGFLLALGALGLHLPRRSLAGLGATAVILVWTVCSLERLPVWHDEVKLYVETSLANPASWRPHENAVISIFALPQIQPFFRLDPDTRQLIADQPPKGADADAMLRALTEAHQLFPDEHRINAALGVAYAQRGQITNAIPFLELAAQQQTNDPNCWIDLGAAYARETNWARARAALETALRISPANSLARQRLQQLDQKPGR